VFYNEQRAARLEAHMKRAAEERRYLDAERMRQALEAKKYLPPGHPSRG